MYMDHIRVMLHSQVHAPSGMRATNRSDAHVLSAYFRRCPRGWWDDNVEHVRRGYLWSVRCFLSHF